MYFVANHACTVKSVNVWGWRHITPCDWYPTSSFKEGSFKRRDGWFYNQWFWFVQLSVLKFFPKFHHNSEICSIALFAAVFISGISLNSLVIYFSHKIQDSSKQVALQILHFQFLCFLLQLSALLPIDGSWAKPCVWFIVFYLSSVRTNMMLALVIDRFLLIFCPFKYPKYNSRVIVYCCHC